MATGRGAGKEHGDEHRRKAGEAGKGGRRGRQAPGELEGMGVVELAAGE